MKTWNVDGCGERWSGSAFGTTLGTGTEVFYEYGQWCTEESEQRSNWKELKNLVDALEGWIQTHSLSGSQLFLFTNNATAEAVYWKGASKSQRLCDLVLRLKCLSLWSSLEMHNIHVSGRRMKSQGTDGLSRRDQNVGVIRGTPMKSFASLHLTPKERVPELKTWEIAPAAGDLAYDMLDK